MATLFMKPLSMGCSSDGIQGALDKTGESLKYSEIHFGSGTYIINSRLFLNSMTTVTCDPGVIFKLANNINFGEQVPIIGQKNSAIHGLDISGIAFDGNYKNQGTTKNNRGKGYGNFIGLSNVTDSKFHNMSGGFNEGDFFRITKGKNLEFYQNTGKMGGHDWLHVFDSDQVKVYDNDIEMRSNNAVRVRSSKNAEIFHNKIHGTPLAYAPAIQVESKVAGKSVTNVSIHNNVIENAYGPGIWVIGTVPGNVGLSIAENQIINNGLMPAANGISGVGGCVIDGFDDVTINSNEIDRNRGYGILFGNYLLKSQITGLHATIENNKITNTKSAFTVGVGSGSGIANIAGKRYTITQSGNILAGNVMNIYGI